MAGGLGVERDGCNGSDGLGGKQGSSPSFMMHFSQIGLKTSHYRASYRMSTGYPNALIGSPVFLQEQADRIRRDLDSGMGLREGIRQRSG